MGRQSVRGCAEFDADMTNNKAPVVKLESETRRTVKVVCVRVVRRYRGAPCSAPVIFLPNFAADGKTDLDFPAYGVSQPPQPDEGALARTPACSMAFQIGRASCRERV